MLPNHGSSKEGLRGRDAPINPHPAPAAGPLHSEGRLMLRGSLTALITPLTDGAVDEKAFTALVDWQINEGTHGLVPVGTTGESPTVTHEEHHRIIEICVETAAGRVPVVAGAGANSTAEAVELPRFAEKVGADAVLSVDTIARLREAHDNFIGVKDATADMQRASLQRAKLGPEFILLSGEDMTALGFNAHGGTGCISVTSNVAPRLCAEFQDACQQGNYAQAIELQDRLVHLHKNLFLEGNPGGVKYAASRL